MNKYRIEFLYDHIKNITYVFVWLGQQIKDKRELNGQISSEQEKKIKTSIELELLEKGIK